jgi:hypothetical protein
VAAGRVHRARIIDRERALEEGLVGVASGLNLGPTGPRRKPEIVRDCFFGDRNAKNAKRGKRQTTVDCTERVSDCGRAVMNCFGGDGDCFGEIE